MQIVDTLSYVNVIGRSFINRLRKHRRLMGYSQSDVAYLLGIKSTSVISRWEKGLTIPMTDTLLRLACIYHTLSEELYREYYKEAKNEITVREQHLAKMRTNEKNIKRNQ